MPTAHVNGVDLYYETTGSGERLLLTHGSWTDGSGWAPSVATLARRFEVVTWDRRGHSRSGDGDHPGSRAEDAADLAGFVDSFGDGRAHLVGNSYGAIVAATVAIDFPDLVASAALHEPPLFGLLEGTRDPAIDEALNDSDARIATVSELLEAGDHRAAAEYFIENVALGRGSWANLPDGLKSVIVGNASTYLDELHDPTALSIDTAALAETTIPLLLTRGTTSPPLFTAVIAELAALVPTARVASIDGAGHIPHATHPDAWTDALLAFHDNLDSTAKPTMA